MNYPKTINDLIECYKKLPGIGEKTAERLALATLNLDTDITELFSTSIKNVKTKIKRCKKCNYFSENDICDICNNTERNNSVICVVDDPKSVILFEKMGTFNGYYHVLNGLISPLDGVTPEQIKIDSLIDRIKKENTEEIIIAVKPSIEGETTALYLSKILEDKEVIVSKIARGVPMGAEMDYIDSLTLEMAFDDRRQIKNKTNN